MATQAYMPRDTGNKKKVDVERLAQTQAPGHPSELQPKDGSGNRTPSPTQPAGVAEMARLKDTAWGRAGDRPEDQNPGKNGFGLASSLPPSQRAAPATIDPHGPAGMDPVLRNLAMGTKRAIDLEDDWQTRPFDTDQKVPTTFGHHKPAASGTIPSVTGHSPMSDEIRRRQAALKRTEGGA
jgi:hypothetical protein